MAAPQRKITSLVRIESSGWRRLGGGIERIALHAVFSDGSESPVVEADMRYKPGFREGLIERAYSGKSTPEDYATMMRIRGERNSKKQALYGELQRRYGHGIPAA
jgi:hypothetical protein